MLVARSNSDSNADEKGAALKFDNLTLHSFFEIYHEMTQCHDGLHQLY